MPFPSMKKWASDFDGVKKIVNLGAERTEYRMVWGRISQLFQPRFDGFC